MAKVLGEKQFLSAAEVAKFVGVSARTVEKWRAEGKIEAFEGKCGLI